MIFFIFFVTHAYIEREGHREQRAKVRGWGVKGREKERGRGLGDRAFSSEQPMPVSWIHMTQSVYTELVLCICYLLLLLHFLVISWICRDVR